MTLRAQGYECNAVTVSRDATCVEVADEMDLNSIGCVVVAVEDEPVGIITDRDLVRRVLADDLDPEKTRAEEVMTPNPVTARRHDNLETLLEVMRDAGVRRVPLTEDGKLVGLISLDDVVVQLGSYIFNANRGVLAGIQESHRTTPHRRRREKREEALNELRSQLTSLGEETRKQVSNRLLDMLEKLGVQR